MFIIIIGVSGSGKTVECWLNRWAGRMQTSSEHSMQPEMSQSQFSDLEEPHGIFKIAIPLSNEEIV